MVRRAQPGQRWTPPAAADQNAIAEATEYYHRHQKLGSGGSSRRNPISTDCALVYNNSGSNRSRGDLLVISGIQTTSVPYDELWLTATTPSGTTGTFCVLREPIPSTKVGTGQISGICMARVNITDTSHGRATPAASTNNLVSSANGPVRIIYKPSGTGIKECAVLLGDWYAYKPLVRFTLSSALATSDASKAGTIQSQFGPGVDSPDTSSGAITLHNLLTTTASTYLYSAVSGAAGYAIWDSGSNYRIIAVEGYKPLVRFTLAAALATSDASKTATIQSQFGPGLANPSTGAGAITVHNLLTSTASTYVFSGSSGDAGLAEWDSGNNYRIVQMEC